MTPLRRRRSRARAHEPLSDGGDGAGRAARARRARRAAGGTRTASPAASVEQRVLGLATLGREDPGAQDLGDLGGGRGRRAPRRAPRPGRRAASGGRATGRSWRGGRRRPRRAGSRPASTRASAALEHERRRRVAHRAVGSRRLALDLGRQRRPPCARARDRPRRPRRPRGRRCAPRAPSASSAGTRRAGPRRRSSSSSSTVGVVNCVSCSARKAASPSTGSSMRAATIGPAGRARSAAASLRLRRNGMPYWRKSR